MMVAATNAVGAMDESPPTDQLRVLAVTAFRPGEIDRSVSQMGDRAAVVSLDGEPGLPTRAVQTVRRTRRAIRHHDPDVLLLDCYETIGFLTTLVALWYGVPIVARLVGDNWRIIEEEGLEDARASRSVQRYLRYRVSLLLDEFVYDRVEGFVTVSNELKDVVERRTGCPPERIEVVPIPVTKDVDSTGDSEVARRSHDVRADRVVLTVTNLLFEAKLTGVETVIRELEPVLERDSNLALVIAGGGPYHDDLLDFIEASIDDPDVRRRIHAPGHADEVAHLYALADVFVYVSHLDGYPNVVLEAQSAGLPAVVNDAHGMREQVREGETGYRIDPAESGALRDRVQLLLSNDNLRESIGTGARRQVLVENSPTTIGDRLETAIENIIAASKSDH